MAKPEKVTAVAEIASRFTESSAAVLTEYRGLTVAQLTEVRRALGPGNSYAVVKNTLTRRAVRDAGLDQLDELLTGPTAIAFITGDPVAPTKGLRDFSRAHPMLVIKGGVLDGRSISPAEISTIADLDSREVLLAKLAGAMKGNLSKAAGLFQAPLAQLARLGAALVDKRTAAGEVADGPTAADSDTVAATAPETPADETPAAETPAAETPAAETPAAETPADETPAAETPAAETPAAETPDPPAASQSTA